MRTLTMRVFSILLVAALGAWLAHGAAIGGSARGPNVNAAATLPNRLELPRANANTQFLPVDLLLDTGSRPLGSYQVEITAKNASIVGLEGGDTPAFRNAPYYDPAALQPGPVPVEGAVPAAAPAGGRIIVAAFSTADTLPTGITRVARLHLALNAAAQPVAGRGGRGGGGDAIRPDLSSRLVVATDGDGQTIQTRVELRLVGAGNEGVTR